jgi:peptidoglycan/LPS O-acetylase OafA/YrhL
MFPLIASTPVWKMLLVMLVGFTLIPLPVSLDIRGWQEMHPLDGPAWSLFFEYIANILYALGIHKLSRKALAVFVLAVAALLVHLAVFGGRGDVIGGWSLDRIQLPIGFARMLYPFFAGMLLMRLGWRIHLRAAFALCSLLLIVCLSLPRFGGPTHLWLNGLYESAVILFVFPLIVAMGAGETIDGTLAHKLCKFCGDISYPLYITHYPWIYLYTAYVTRNKTPALQGAILGALLLLITVAIAYACLKLYDEPVRAWLTRRFLTHPTRS